MTDKEFLARARDNLSDFGYTLFWCALKTREEGIFSPMRIVGLLECSWEQFDNGVEELIQKGYFSIENDILIINELGKESIMN